MRRYFVKRLSVMVPMLLGVTVITFIIMNLAPGDPVMMFVNVERGVPTPEELGRLRAVLGLDKPAVIRYFIWLKNLVTGDFGYSYFSRQPVMNEIKTRIGTTVLLAVLSMGVSFLFGMTVGVVCALKQYKVADYILSVLAFIGLSMPGFWVAIMLIFFFTSRLGWFPSVGLSDVSLVNPGLLARIADRASHLVMPVMAMSLTSIGGWARYQRSSFLEVINQDYIRTARSKGLSENAITLRHALRNSALPIITILGDSMPILIGGAFIIESIFGLPGMGRLGINAIMNKDYPVVMGVTFFSSIMVILGTFLSDILYAVIDPRIRFR